MVEKHSIPLEKVIFLKDGVEKPLKKVFSQDYDISKLQNAVKEFGITKASVKEVFSNGHTARGILVYVLCDHLNSKYPDEKWKVKRGVGESLALKVNNNSKKAKLYEFHVFERVTEKDVVDEDIVALSHTLNSSYIDHHFYSYFFADIRNLEKIVFYELNKS